MKRVFVFQDFKSQKFWSIEVVGTDVTVNYGKLGTDGQTQVKNYATTEEAEKAANKLIAEKTKKGYVETAEETAREMKVEAKKYTLSYDEYENDVKLLDKILKDKHLSEYKQITIGCWDYEGDDCSALLQGLIENKDKFAQIEGLFWGDIEQEEQEISITKVTFALLFNSVLLLVIVLCVAHWYRKRPQGAKAPGGFIGFMEMFIMMVNDDIIKSCVGPNYRKFAPYLLTAFFFIFINNMMGLIPFFPGGANVTGNIAITMVLAVCTFLAVNIFGTKHYWKDIFWPDVPWWLKVPVPMMPFIEFFGIFTKPFALMIRLFANMLAGHMAMLVLTCLIFISASMGPALNGTLTVASVLFNIFMNALELLVAFIQAYVFTMLSAVFIGLAQEGAKVKAE